MLLKLLACGTTALLLVAFAGTAFGQDMGPDMTKADMKTWEEVKSHTVHDMERERPEKVTPGQHEALEDTPIPPPSDATVLFDGTDMSMWEKQDGSGAPGWKIENGYVEVVAGTGSIQTKDSYGDVQLHVEWRAPMDTSRTGQNAGNSGVFLMGVYEVQVLDTYENETYPDGQASSLYGQYPPLVNASRPPGEWQTYDIIFTRPRFNEDGSLASPAYVTVLHNGVLTQNHVALTGPTGHRSRPEYEAHEDALPIGLQDHNEPVRFRNIWLRELE